MCVCDCAYAIVCMYVYVCVVLTFMTRRAYSYDTLMKHFHTFEITIVTGHCGMVVCKT